MKTVINIVTEEAIPEGKREKFNSQLAELVGGFIVKKAKKWGFSFANMIDVGQPGKTMEPLEGNAIAMARDATYEEVGRFTSHSHCPFEAGWKVFTLSNGDIIFGGYPTEEQFEFITHGKHNAG